MKAKKCKTKNCYRFTEKESGLCQKCEVKEKSIIKQKETAQRKKNMHTSMYDEIREKSKQFWGNTFIEKHKYY